VIHHTVVEIFTTQMSISGSRLDFENTIFNRQDWYIESSTTEIENEDIAFSTDLWTTKTLVIIIREKI
jgi:hypothetical protein